MPQVVVIGGGLTGLAVAFRLKQQVPGASITVLEARDRAGGNVGTEKQDGFLVERGPNGFLDRTPHLPRLVHDLGLTESLQAASEGSRKNRYLFLRGQLRRLPTGPLGLLFSSVLSVRGALRLFTEPWRPRLRDTRKDESIAEFVSRRAGKEAADVIADALVTGIQAGDPALLSVAATFPRLPLMEREAGSIIRGFLRAARQRRREARARGEPPPKPQQMWSFREGLATLPNSLAKDLGPIVKCGVEVQRVARDRSHWFVRAAGADSWFADAVVLACPAYEQARILADLDGALAREIGDIPYNRIAVVALGYRKSDCPFQPDGFGYIAPQNTRRDVLGVQWSSVIYPGQAPPDCVLWRALCGGVNRGEMVDWDDERLARAVHKEMQLAMGVRGEPVFRRIIRWPRAIPQYVIGHCSRLARIETAAARFPGLFLTGNAYLGVSMGDCAEQGELVAASVSEYLGKSAQPAVG